MFKKSPARAHFERKKAQLQAPQVDTLQKPVSNAYELIKAALIEDRRRLHDVQSIENKIKLKAQLLPNYREYVEGVIAADAGANDDVLATIMVWQFDVGNLSEALKIAQYALKHGIKMPDQYQRSVAATAAEESADTALRLLSGVSDKAQAESILQNLNEVLALTESHDMHDQIRAKLHKVIGLYTMNHCEAPEVALDHFQRALALNPNVGVKKQIQQMESAIKKAQKAPAEN